MDQVTKSGLNKH